MRNVIILGAGTAGATMANRLCKTLPASDWRITVIDRESQHFYQPGFLFIPFGVYDADGVTRPIADPLPEAARHLTANVELIKPEKKLIQLEDGSELSYDILIIATGCAPHPEEIEGLAEADWGERVHEFYTYGGACKLAQFFEGWAGGRLVVDVAEMPIKCPVAPIEFVFLADWWFSERGLRDKVEIELVTPLPGAFTKPICSDVMGHLLTDKGIKLTTEYSLASVDAEARVIRDWEDTSIGYDCLVVIAPNMGDPLIQRSGLGDELNFVPTDPGTLRSKAHENIFVLGDATDLPSSKAGSVAHFEAEVLTENIKLLTQGKPLKESFDGHTNCFIETGHGKGVMVDFNYETEPLPGTFPLPHVGPFSLLKESRVNHWGKMAFRWVYWNMLLKGKELHIPTQMSMAGKVQPEQQKDEKST